MPWYFDRPYSIVTAISRYLGCLSRKVFFFFMSSSSYIFPTHLTFFSSYLLVGLLESGGTKGGRGGPGSLSPVIFGPDIQKHSPLKSLWIIILTSGFQIFLRSCPRIRWWWEWRSDSNSSLAAGGRTAACAAHMWHGSSGGGAVALAVVAAAAAAAMQ